MMRRSALFLLCFSSAILAQQTGAVGDWPDWRGPDRDGISAGKGLCSVKIGRLRATISAWKVLHRALAPPRLSWAIICT